MASDAQQIKILLQVHDREFARELKKNTARIDRFAKQSNRSLSRTTRGFNGLAMGMRGLLPALGAAVLIAKTKRVVAELDEIGKTADNIGLTTDALQELRVIAESSGLTFDEFTKGFTKFSVNVGEASTGVGEAIGAFEALGIELFDTNGILKDAETLFNEVADGMAGFANDSERASVAADLFGQRVGIKMLNMLRNGSDGMADMRAEARKLGVVIDEELIRKAEGAQTELDLLGRVMNAQVATALINLIPLLLAVGRGLVAMSSAAGNAFSDVRSFIDMASAGGAENLTIDEQAIIVKGALRRATEEQADATERLLALQARVGRGQGDIDSPRFLQELSEKIAAATADIEKFELTLENLNGLSLAGVQDSDATFLGSLFAGAVGIEEMTDALIAEREALVGLTEAQRLAAIESEAAALGESLRAAALREGIILDEDMTAAIDLIINNYRDEAIALDEAKNARAASNAGRAETIELIDDEREALELLEERNAQQIRDFIDILAGADNLNDGLNALLKMFVKLAATSFLQGLFGVVPENQTGLASSFSNLGGGLNGRASGGAVQAGSPYMVGESGPEPFVPAQNGRVLSVAQAKSAVGGGGSGFSQSITINMTTGIQSTVRAEMMSMLPQIAEVAKGAVLDANQRGGAFRKSLTGG